MDDFKMHKENIKTFVSATMFNVKRMYRVLSKELDQKTANEHALWGFHSMAYSSFMSLQNYYLQSNELSHWEFDNFIEKFEQFSSEFVSSRETKHSMQWTFGYYYELVDAFNDLANLLDLNPIEKPE